MWDYEEIRELHAPEPGQKRPRLDHLLEIGAVCPDTLCFLADALEARGPEFVGVLFQLPFQMAIDEEWIVVPTSADSVRAEVALLPAYLRLESNGRFNLAVSGEAGSDERPITQGVAIFQVWGKRQRAHERYHSVIDHRSQMDPIVVPQRESWIDNRPITASSYELNFSRRLRIEVQHMLRMLLPTYSLLSKTETPVLRWVYGFAPMLTPGRISDGAAAIPIAKHFLSAPEARPRVPVNGARLEHALRNPHRELGRFELQLLAMERLRREGEVAMALIGTTALLEWLLSDTVRTRGGRSATLHAVLSDPALTFLPPDLLRTADEARKLRNRLVHGAPPKRRAISSAVTGSSAEREIIAEQIVSASELASIIDAAFEIFRQVNLNRAA